MSLIEGVDDEIVVAIGAFTIVSAAVVLAWRSTRVDNSPADQSQQQQQPQNIDGHSAQDELNQSGQNQAENDPPPATGQPMKIKLKFLNDTERIVDVTGDWKIGQLKRIHLAQELDGGRKMVRLVFRGRELADVNQKISETGLSDMATVHCLVSPVPVRSAGENVGQQRNAVPVHRVQSAGYDNVAEYDEVGRLLMPLLTIVLGCVWYARIRYRSLFDGFSSLALVAFTIAFLAAVAAHLYRLLGFGQHHSTNTTQQTQPEANSNRADNSSSTANQQLPTISENHAPDAPSYPPPPYSPNDHSHAD